MPLEALGATVADHDEQPGARPSPLESALARVSDLHGAVEAGPDGLEGISPELAKRLRLLIESLDKVDAGLEIQMSLSDGSERRPSLTRRGREHGRALFAPKVETAIETIVGVLAAVEISDEFAKILVRPGGKKRAIPIVRVPADIAKRDIDWDVSLRILVRTEQSQDRFEGRKRREHQFIRLIAPEEPQPIELGWLPS